jgi:hypothetical protein
MPKDKRFEFNKETDYSLKNLQNIYDELKSTPDFIPTPESMQHISLKLTEMLMSQTAEPDGEQISSLLANIQHEMSTRMLVDEVHHGYTKPRDLGYKIQLSNHDQNFLQRSESVRYKQLLIKDRENDDVEDNDDDKRPKA